MKRFEGFEQWLRRPDRSGVDGRWNLHAGMLPQWFDALYDSPVLFSGLLDRRGVVLEGNHLAVEGCGLDRATTIGKPFWEGGWWSPDDALAERIRTWCTRTVATGEALSAVSRYFRGDASMGMVELGLVPVIDFDEPGQPVSHIVATGLDISSLLATQAEREDRLTAASENSRLAEKRFRDALDAMIDHVTIARSVRDEAGAIIDFEIVFVNQPSIDGAGRSSAELVGRRVCELYPLWRHSGMFDRFLAVVETGQPYIADRTSYGDVLDDGTPISGYWDLRVSLLDDGYIAASRDVTDVVRVEQEVQANHAATTREHLAMEILQSAALSVDLPRRARGHVGLHYQPAGSAVPIGGDWYDVIGRPDGRLNLIIADVAGHGPDIASFMVQLRNILRAVAMEEPDPAELLRRANSVVIALHTTAAPFTTCCVALVEPDGCGLTWSLAGHPPPLLASRLGSRFLTSPPGLPLGLRMDAEYTSSSTVAELGDRLVLYTDGLIESRRQSLDTGMDRLRVATEQSLELAPQDAAEWLADHVSSGADDVALIVADIVAPS